MDVDATLRLANAAHPRHGLLVVGIAEIQRIVHADAACCERESHACGLQLADEHLYIRIRLESLDLFGAILHVTFDQRVADVLFVEHPGDCIDLRHEAGKHNDLFAFLHAAVDHILQRIELCLGDLLRIITIVIADETACDLGEAEQLRQHVPGCDFTVHELGEAVLFNAVVDLLGILLQLDRMYLFHELRQIDRFVDADPECDGMRFFDKFRQMLVPDDLVILESAENGVVGAEAVEAASEDAFVQKLVLAEEVQRAVGDRRSCQDQVVAADLAEPMQGFRALRLRVLDLARFITDDHVRVPSGQLCFQTPAAFIVHYDDLQAVADHVPDRVRLLCAAAVENGQRIVERCELAKFLIPHVHDGFRANDQKLQHLVLVIERSRQCDRSDRFAGSHIHEEGASFTCHRDHFLPSAPWQEPCAVVCAACPA